jgi:glycogen debranching enzyme
LKEQFNREFWMPQRKYYAMALDGHHRQVDTVTSNPGHGLWTGIVAEEHAGDMAATLLSDPMASAWGIRSMANTEKAYNPLSYHNGSVWPFENTLIGAGLKNYGYVDGSNAVFDLLVDASSHFEYRRLPEVYAGVARDLIYVLALQPDASRPQAWSASSIFLWLKTWLGISPRPFAKHFDITPSLPPDVGRLTATNLSIAGSRVGISVSREHDGAASVRIFDNPDGLSVTIHPVPQVQADRRLATRAKRPTLEDVLSHVHAEESAVVPAPAGADSE